jgi:peptidoglycan/LPS O-acetylase OafA/YrhL
MPNTVIHGEGLGKNSPSLNLSGRIPELDGIRGLAIGLVLIWHYFVLHAIPIPGTAVSYVLVFGRLTWSGVDLFFVLSGFLIGGILLDARQATNYFKVFYTRRFFRIVPIYAAVLLAFPALVLATRWVPGDFTWVTDKAMPWYSYWTFTQNFWMANANRLGAGALGITWSLAIEEQFYLTLPLLVRFLSGRKLLVCVLTGIFLAPVARMTLLHYWPHNWVAAFALMPCRADALLLGVLAAILLRDERWTERLRQSRLVFAISFPVLLLGVAFFGWKAADAASPLMRSIGYTWLALFYVAVLLFALTRRNGVLSAALRNKSLGWLGTIAYGTYLLHQTMQGIVFGYFWGHEPRITGVYAVLTALAALALTLIIARLSWRYFEQPLIRFGHRPSYKFEESSAKGSAKSAPEMVYP